MKQLQINVIRRAISSLDTLSSGELYIHGDAGAIVGTAVTLLEAAIRELEQRERVSAPYNGPRRRQSDVEKGHVQSNDN